MERKNGEYRGTYNGKEIRYPSVTHVLSLLTDFSSIPAEILKRAADYGTAVHTTLEYFEKGILKRTTLAPELELILQAWEGCKKEKKINVIETEKIIISEQYKYAGRLDMVATVGGVVVLVEIKSRNYMAVTDDLQTAAYMQAYNEGVKNNKIKKRVLVSFDLDGGYKYKEIKQTKSEPEHFKVFLSVLAAYKWKNKK